VTGANASRPLSLWLLTAPIAAWGVHFLAVYVVAAVYCARAATLATAASTQTDLVRWAVLAVTLLLLSVDAVAALRGLRPFRGARSGDTANRPDQDRFLGSVVIMLSVLSAVAMIFIAAVALLYGDCRR
jgi:hypothetical protein